jgi:hypothetical protein
MHRRSFPQSATLAATTAGRAIGDRRFFYGDLAESMRLRVFDPDFIFFHKIQRAEALLVKQVGCAQLSDTFSEQTP